MIDLDRVKKHLNVDFVEDDDYIESLIEVAEIAVYNHINTYSLEYIMLFSLVTIMYLKNQERKYICYPQPYYEE